MCLIASGFRQSTLPAIVADESVTISPSTSFFHEKSSMTLPLASLVEQAWAAGQGIDLKEVQFGPSLPGWKDDRFFAQTFPYYFFLAGLVRSQQCSRILEIGTHYGGSGLAMLRGVAEPDQAKLLTIDITDLNPALHSVTGLKKITGDANSEAVISQIFDYFAGETVDLIYIDTNHSFMPTLLSLGIYGFLLRPRFIVMDDIHLAEGMRKIWARVCGSYSEAINCIDVVPAIRREQCGFGLLRLRLQADL